MDTKKVLYIKKQIKQQNNQSNGSKTPYRIYHQ